MILSVTMLAGRSELLRAGLLYRLTRPGLVAVKCTGMVGQRSLG